MDNFIDFKTQLKLENNHQQMLSCLNQVSASVEIEEMMEKQDGKEFLEGIHEWTFKNIMNMKMRDRQHLFSIVFEIYNNALVRLLMLIS